LDAAIIEQIKSLTEQGSSFITQLEKSRRFYTGDREQYESQLTSLRSEFADNEKAINGLIDSLGMASDSAVKPRLLKRIEELSETNRNIENRIHELEGLVDTNALSDAEFDLLRQMLSVFRTSVDTMSVEEKRAAIRTVVRKVIWDGVNAHVILFGADEEIEFPDIKDRFGSDEEPLEEEDDMVSETPWGEDSK
jgi:site-specific DNA recombinase